MTSIRSNNFDLIRLMAALQVVIVHCIEHLGLRDRFDSKIWFWFNAFPGVPVFFVISGFLISRSLERCGGIKLYAINRILRIYPALFVCFFITIASVLFASPHLFYSAKIYEFIGWCLAQLTIAQFFNPSFLRSYGVGAVNGSLWTIPVELQFYFALPVTYKILGLSTSKRNLALVFVMLGFLLLSLLFENWITPQVPLVVGKLIAVTMLPYYWMFLLGVISQRNWTACSSVFEGKLLPWIVGYCLSVAVLNSLGLNTTGNTQFPLATLVLTGVVLSAAFTFPSISQKVLNGNDVSYGMYIYHMVIVNFMLAFGIENTWSSLIIAVLSTIVMGFLSWRMIEVKALSLKPRNDTRHDASRNDAASVTP